MNGGRARARRGTEARELPTVHDRDGSGEVIRCARDQCLANAVVFTEADARGIREYHRVRFRLHRLERGEAVVFEGFLDLLVEVGSVRYFLERRGLGENMWCGKLGDSVDPNLLWGCSEG